MASEQREHLDRVRYRIAQLVLEFRDRQGGRPFHADDLRNFVIKEARVAPASADRILRDLRQRGVFDYVVLNRRQSLYQFIDASAPMSLFDPQLDDLF